MSQNQLAKVYENSKDEVSQLAGMCLMVRISRQGKMTEGCMDSPSLCIIKLRPLFLIKVLVLPQTENYSEKCP